MSRLTWQQVANPNFSGSNETLRLMTDLINRSTGGLDRALGEFQEDRSRQESGALMRDTLALQDPEALRAALSDGSLFAGRNAGAINPAAFNFTAGQAQRLLNERGTEAQTALTGVNTDAARYRLGRSQTLDRREDNQYEARQRVQPHLAEAERIGRTQGAAAAEEYLRQHENDLLAAGLPFDAAITTALGGQNRGQQMFRDTEAFNTFVRNASNARSARELVDLVLAEFTNPAEGAEAIRSLAGQANMNADIMREALTSLEGHPGFSPQNPEMAELFLRYGRTPPSTGRGEPWSAGVTALSGNRVFNTFMNTVETGGLTNPAALAAVAATVQHESGFSSANADRTWNDPSETGRPGTAGGIMSWNNDRLASLQRFAASRGESGNGSLETQAAFFLQENPELINRLNGVSSVQEAMNLMNNAWRFAGYNREGGERDARLRTALSFSGQGGAVSTRTGPELSFNRGSPSTGSPEGEAPPVDQMLDAASGDRIGEDESSPSTRMTPEEQAALDSASLARDAQTPRERIQPLVDAPEADTDNAEAVSAALSRALADNPNGFTDAQEGLDFLISQGQFPEGTTIEDVGTDMPIARVASRYLRDAAREAREPREGSEAPQGSEDPQRRRLHTDVAGVARAGARIGLNAGEQVANTATESVNALLRGAGAASGYVFGTEGDVFQFPYADFDGDGFAQNPLTAFGGARAVAPGDFSTADPATLALRQAVGEEPDQSSTTIPDTDNDQQGGQEQVPSQTPRMPSSAASLPKAISIARSSIAMDNTNNPFAYIDNMIISGEGMGVTPSEVAARLNSQSYGNIDTQDLVNIVTRITNELGIDPGIAGALLEYAHRTNPGRIMRFFGGSSDVDMNSIRNIWNEYQDFRSPDEGGRGQSIAPGIRRVEMMQDIGRRRAQIDSIEADYDRMIAMRDQLLIQNTPDSRAQAEQLENVLIPAMMERLDSIVASGITPYSDTNTGR